MPVREIGSAEFDKFTSGTTAAVVDVWAPWCGPCRVVSPIVDRLSEKFKEKVPSGR